MSPPANLLWINASPSLQWLDKPLLCYLAKRATVRMWQYSQTPDEASSLETAVELLAEYLTEASVQGNMHLLGHGVSGIVGLLCARRHPKLVQSLTLLSVAERPATTWHAHYYIQRKMFGCCRRQLLGQTVQNLFGSAFSHSASDVEVALNRDLEEAPHMHSLFNLTKIPQGGISMPLMVCGSQTDSVMGVSSLRAWKNHLKAGDKLWLHPEGRHYFHYFYPQEVGDRICKFLGLQAPSWRREALLAGERCS